MKNQLTSKLGLGLVAATLLIISISSFVSPKEATNSVVDVSALSSAELDVLLSDLNGLPGVTAEREAVSEEEDQYSVAEIKLKDAKSQIDALASHPHGLVSSTAGQPVKLWAVSRNSLEQAMKNPNNPSESYQGLAIYPAWSNDGHHTVILAPIKSFDGRNDNFELTYDDAKLMNFLEPCPIFCPEIVKATSTTLGSCPIQDLVPDAGDLNGDGSTTDLRCPN